MGDEPQEHQIIQKTAHAIAETMDSTMHKVPLPAAIPAVMVEGLLAAPVLLNAFAVDEVNEWAVQPVRHLFGGDSVEASAAPNIDIDLPREEPAQMHEEQVAYEDPPPPPPAE
jgi:hypothetical protein